MDEDMEEEFTIEMEQRMHAPLEWDSPPICKMQDLKEAQYEEALRLIKVQQRERENLERTCLRVLAKGKKKKKKKNAQKQL